MPAKDVKAYVKRNTNDAADARAGAGTPPSLSFRFPHDERR
jgi:hypothetical protein